ncbi:trypsin-like peptidase domain-containing protein [Proteus sp. PR00174]|uniref:trypsin-like serine peptidase n=1 Tax=Proteus sp. PR00174 TaxID=2794024 RepID=UPI0018E47213|nr:serine protease [Proteus sp. PR00174]MBI6511430.1 trypsin-like peptidase domain-containing protein [Proteus sp. PR00174]
MSFNEPDKTISNNKLENLLHTLTFKSLFIEMYFNEQKLSSGTAFLVANDHNSHCSLITNRHNVTGRNQQTGECLNKLCATPNYIIIYFHKNNSIGEWHEVKIPLYYHDDTPRWIEDPILGSDVDVVALNLCWGSNITKIPYFINTNLDRDNLYIGPADTVSVIGFPFGISAYGKFPVWATGFIAQDLQLMSDDKPYFLIDCRARQGQSGSPVAAYRTGGYRIYEPDGKISSVLSATPKWEFLGIYSGRINSESDLGVVWSVSVISRVLNAAEKDYKNRGN